MINSEEKSRYWLKLDKDFLKSPHIKVIKSMPNGKDYVLFYLSLMLESIENVGHLKFTDLIPYNDEMLSALTDTNIDVVRNAVKVFEQLGLLEKLTDGTIFLSQVAKMTGKRSESADRVAKHRALKKAEYEQLLHVTKSNDNIYIQSTEYKEENTEYKIQSTEYKKQRTKNKEQRKEKNSKEDNEILIQNQFELFWEAYPKKIAKKTVMQKFKKLNPNENLFKKIMTSLEIHKKTAQWQNAMYIPSPLTWINQERWEDVISIQEEVRDVLDELLEEEQNSYYDFVQEDKNG